MTVKIAIIAAVAENGVIGNGDKLPWSIKSEMKHFKATTRNKPVIMGRKTFKSIGKPLKERTNIVVTRDDSYNHEGVIVASSLETALEIAKTVAEEDGQDEIMVAGGAEIYKQAIGIADRIYLTRIHSSPKGDTKFPEFNKLEWHEVKSEFHHAQEGETYDYSLRIFDRIENSRT